MSDWKLSWDEVTIVSEMIETILSDSTNTAGFFDRTSGGALSDEDVAEYRAALTSAQVKLRSLSVENGGLALTRGQQADQAIRFAAYMREALHDGNVNHAIAFAECLAAVAIEIAAALRRPPHAPETPQ
jgi:hypothetical protein